MKQSRVYLQYNKPISVLFNHIINNEVDMIVFDEHDNYNHYVSFYVRPNNEASYINIQISPSSTLDRRLQIQNKLQNLFGKVLVNPFFNDDGLRLTTIDYPEDNDLRDSLFMIYKDILSLSAQISERYDKLKENPKYQGLIHSIDNNNVHATYSYDSCARYIDDINHKYDFVKFGKKLTQNFCEYLEELEYQKHKVDELEKFLADQVIEVKLKVEADIVELTKVTKND